MIGRLLVIALVISVIFVSGCVEQKSAEAGGVQPSAGGATGGAIEAEMDNMLEEEMEQAIENITIEDIENSLAE